MNLVQEFLSGQQGRNKGLPYGPGLEPITKATNGIQRCTSIGVGAAPKVGKSTFVDCAYILGPYLEYLKLKDSSTPLDIQWIYFSYEMDRVSKEFDFCCYFLHNEHNIEKIQLPEGIYYENDLGKIVNHIYLSSEYLRGRLVDTAGKTILVDTYVRSMLKKVYEERIIPLFGEFSKEGSLLKKGLITFFDHAENPTGLRNHIMKFAESRGQFLYDTYRDKNGVMQKKLIGYQPNNSEEYVIIITDTVRKLQKERGFNLKETIDKYLEYSTFLRNLCKYVFVNIIHINRDLGDVNKLKYLGEHLHPVGDNIKDSGNLSEESSHLFTLFNPNDEKYGLNKHFGVELRGPNKGQLYPNLRTVHLVESRLVRCPQHFRFNMLGHVKTFKQFKIN